MLEETPQLGEFIDTQETHGTKNNRPGNQKKGKKNPTLKEQDNKNEQILVIDNFQYQWSPSPPPKKTDKQRIWKHNLSFNSIQETQGNIKDKHHLRAKGWAILFQANEPKKKASVAVVNDKIDFNPKLIIRDRERQEKFTKRILQFLSCMHQTEKYPSLKKIK